ncbi:MAG: thioredoxin-disulfide reductase [Desulfuromonadaceae bacterium]|nr:thioredoxin-disulfide reductase [Desulfuromonadaceae bacterium]
MQKKDNEILNVIILGSGPAGLTAAIYAARANLEPLVIHGSQPGGQLTTTTLVENYPGFAEGIDGPVLMEEMEKQARRFGARFLAGEVTKVELDSYPFTIHAGDDSYRCRTLIIATGASPRLLDLPHEKELYGKGVSVCATCDGFFYRDKEVAVVGGGDTAMEEATFLTRFASKVHVIHRRDALRASPPLQERAFANQKIVFHWDSVVSAILGDKQKGLTGIRLKNVATGKEEEMICDGLFIAIGHIPNTGLFKGQVEMEERGYLLTGTGARTNIPGVFAAGDVQDPHFRQAITAAASGCMAAIQAERFLEENP